jgi:hypothetical protein
MRAFSGFVAKDRAATQRAWQLCGLVFPVAKCRAISTGPR